MNNKNVILVTGATGNVGRHVVSQLLREGVRVRALTHCPASSGLPREVDVVRGDLASPETLDAALNGTDAAFLLWRLPNADTAPEVVERMSKHTRRIVFLSTSTIRDDIEEQTDVIAKIHADRNTQSKTLRGSGHVLGLAASPRMRFGGGERKSAGAMSCAGPTVLQRSLRFTNRTLPPSPCVRFGTMVIGARNMFCPDPSR